MFLKVRRASYPLATDTPTQNCTSSMRPRRMTLLRNFCAATNYFSAARMEPQARHLRSILPVVLSPEEVVQFCHRGRMVTVQSLAKVHPPPAKKESLPLTTLMSHTLREAPAALVLEFFCQLADPPWK
jgi:hypothetical protein